MFAHAHSYEGIAGRLAAPLYRRVAADVAAAIADGTLAPDARILDVGTGPGLVPRRIAATCSQVRIDAVDLAPAMITHATEAAAGQARITFTVGDVASLPFDDQSFDLVVSSISQHHWDDPAAGMQDISRVLRPGAPAWIYDFRPALKRALVAANAVRPPRAVHRQNLSRFSPVARIVLSPA